jgi:hypothetical protein
MEISPRQGRFAVRGGRQATPRGFDYSGAPLTIGWCSPEASCLPAAGSVHLYTDPSLVLAHLLDGTCWSNGAQVACPTSGSCSTPGRFCAPIRVTSNYASPLANVVLQLSQASDDQNQVDGCDDQSDALTSGLCALGQASVDAPDSNLSSPITPSVGYPCSYCVGNAGLAAAQAGFEGLATTLLPGLLPVLGQVNTIHVELALANDNDMGVDFSLRTTQPALSASQAQLEVSSPIGKRCTRAGDGSSLIVRGHGFGAPAPCWENPASSCPSSGEPADGHMLLADGQLLDVVSWADHAVNARFLAAPSDSRVTLATPLGQLTTSEYVPVCTADLAGVPAQLGPGQRLTMTGSGFQAGETVSFFIDEQTWGSPVVADASGNFARPATSFFTLDNGRYTIAALGASSGQVVLQEVEVVGSLSVQLSGNSLTGFGAGNVTLEVDGLGLGSFTAGPSFSWTTSIPAGPPTSTVIVTQTATGIRRLAFVDRPPAAIVVSRNPVLSQEQLSVSLSGFLNESISLELAERYLGGAICAYNCTVSVTVPSLPNGVHLLRATGSTSRRTLVLPVTIGGGLTASPAIAAEGAQVTITGSGYVPGSPVRLSAEGATLTDVTPDASGGFVYTLTVPAVRNTSNHNRMHVLVEARQLANNAYRSVVVERSPGAAAIGFPASGLPGAPFAGTVRGFLPGETVQMGFNEDNWTSIVVGSGGQGAFSTTVPALPPGPAQVRFFGWTSGLQVIIPFQSAGSLTLNPSSAASGPILSQLTGTGFVPSSQVTISVNGGTSLVVLTNATGGFSIGLAMPSTTLRSVPVQVFQAGGSRRTFFRYTSGTQASLAASPTTLGTWGNLGLTLSNFQLNENVELLLPEHAQTVLFNTNPKVVTVNLRYRPAGMYTIRARGTASGRLATATVTVVEPTLTVPAEVTVGQSVVVSGTGFAPNQPVNLSMAFTALGAAGNAGADGSFSRSVVVPNGYVGDVFIEAFNASAVGGRLKGTTVRRLPQVNLTRTSGASGYRFVAQVTGFYNEQFVAYVNGQSLASGLGGTSGAVVNVNVNPPWLPAGSHTLEVRGLRSGAIVRRSFTTSESLTLSSNDVAAGDSLRLIWSGLGAAESVTVSFAGDIVLTASADVAGVLDQTISVPSGPAGDVVVQVQGTSGSLERRTVRRRGVFAVTPTQLGPGGRVALTASGLQNNDILNLELDGHEFQGTFTTSGNLSLPNLTPTALAPGVHELRLRSRYSGRFTTSLVSAADFFVAPNGGQAGDTLAFTGSGFVAGETVEVRHRQGTVVTSVVAGPGGTVNGSFVIPAGPAGPMAVHLRGATSGVRRTVQIVRR